MCGVLVWKAVKFRVKGGNISWKSNAVCFGVFFVLCIFFSCTETFEHCIGFLNLTESKPLLLSLDCSG